MTTHCLDCKTGLYLSCTCNSHVILVRLKIICLMKWRRRTGFCEKCITNTVNYLLHTICVVRVLSFVNSMYCASNPLHYSSLFTEHRQNLFFTKKLNFMKHDESTSTHYSSSTAVFAKTEDIHCCSKKSTLCLSRDGLLWWTCLARSFL